MRVLSVLPDLSSTIAHDTGGASYGLDSLTVVRHPVGAAPVRRAPALDPRLGGRDPLVSARPHPAGSHA